MMFITKSRTWARSAVAAAAFLLAATPALAGSHGGKGEPGKRQGEQRGMHDRSGRHERFESVLAKLPEEKAQLVRDTFAKLREDHRTAREAKRAAHENLSKAFAADPFDAKAFAAAHDAMGADQAARHKAHGDALAALAAKLTPAERVIVAEIFAGMGKRGMDRGAGNRDGDDDDDDDRPRKRK
jgi:Spy/CpxP family protein refolding chaperone